MLPSRFRCIRCAATYGLDEVVYDCRACGGLLEVAHDEQRFTARDPEEWQEPLETRRAPYDSGVWRYTEWACRGLPDSDIVSLGEGGAPNTGRAGSASSSASAAAA